MFFTGDGLISEKKLRSSPTSVKLVDSAETDSPAENLEMKRSVAWRMTYFQMNVYNLKQI